MRPAYQLYASLDHFDLHHFFTGVKRRNIERDKEGNNNITQGIQCHTTNPRNTYYFNEMCASPVASNQSTPSTFPPIYELKRGIAIYIFYSNSS